MESSWKPPGPGALDDTPWPEKLTARAVTGDATDDRLHGYAVLGDLAKHYRFSDTLFLALVGELPDGRTSALFELALQTLAAPRATEASVHLAILTRLSGAPAASAISAGLIVAADQAHALVRHHADLLRWLAAPTPDVPAVFGGDEPYSAALAAAVSRIAPDQTLVRATMTRDAATIATLFLAGIQSPEQLQGALLAPRICGIAAESLATGPDHLSLYPVKLPPFRYVED